MITLIVTSLSHAAIIDLGNDYYINGNTGLLVYSPTGIEAENFSVIDYQLGLEYKIQNIDAYSSGLNTHVATFTEIMDFVYKINSIADETKTLDIFSSLHFSGADGTLEFGYNSECNESYGGGCGNIMLLQYSGGYVDWASSLDTYACGYNQWGDGLYTTCDFLYITDLNAVPIPAAVWLFGSGLIALVGFSRRKRA